MSGFYISLVFSNVRRVKSQSNVQLRLLQLLYDVDFTCVKQKNTLFLCFILKAAYVLFSDKTWVFNQPERVQGPIYIINCIVRNINGYLHSTSCLVDRDTILKLRRKYVFGIG